MTIQWTDVTDWSTLFAPQDGQAIHDAVLTELALAKADGAVVFSSQYSITDQDILDALKACMANPASRALFDSSEFFGEKEKPMVEAFIEGLPAEQWGIGTSSVDGNILHDKVLAILFSDGTGWSFSGSFNLTESAQGESNIAHLIGSRSLAEAIAAQVQTNLSWCQANQPQPPTEKPSY
jgi:phosphatidylserine/phosphatidylglycerophosphate/cardiolipin synthase-like enzyme